ncbi:hypothetical protein GCM10029992_65070 [Glycomyces albus]
MKRSKKYSDLMKKVDKARLYAPAEAAELAKETSPTKFDATVEVALRLGVDPRQADQLVRGTVPAQRHRQDRPGHRLRGGRQGRGRRGRRRRRGRLRRPGQADL